MEMIVNNFISAAVNACINSYFNWASRKRDSEISRGISAPISERAKKPSKPKRPGPLSARFQIIIAQLDEMRLGNETQANSLDATIAEIKKAKERNIAWANALQGEATKINAESLSALLETFKSVAGLENIVTNMNANLAYFPKQGPYTAELRDALTELDWQLYKSQSRVSELTSPEHAEMVWRMKNSPPFKPA